MNLGLAAFVITLAVIVISIISRKCTEALFAGTVVAGIFLFGKNFGSGWISVLVQEVSDNTWLWLLLGLFGSLTCLFETSKSTLGFSKTVNRFCKSEVSCKLVALLLGFVIFVDDYLNVMAVGLCMKKSFDERKIPREGLAFLVDCTGTPVCILVPISTWAAFYSNMFAKYGCTSYVSLIPYMFYPMIVILFLLLFCLGVLPGIGPMKKASFRISDSSDNADTDCTSFLNLLIPLVILLLVSIVSEDILIGISASIVTCFVLYVPQKIISVSDFTKACIIGFSKTVRVFFLLAGCYMLKNLTAQMQMGQFIINLVGPVIRTTLLPALTFLIAAFLSFSTGCVWGTSALIAPILLPLASGCDANLTMVMAAVISGGVFGAQACVYSDTTVMSATSSGITNIEHAFSQLPYICIAAGVSFVLYVIAGFIL